MKRPLLILLGGVFLAALAYSAVYFAGTARHRAMLDSAGPELLWLQREFGLDDAELERISELHDAYLPHCMEMCRRIGEKNVEIKELLAASEKVTPAVEEKLREAAQLRADCQKQMLEHFFTVSQAMPPEQGRRYLAWVQERTFLTAESMGHSAHGN